MYLLVAAFRLRRQHVQITSEPHPVQLAEHLNRNIAFRLHLSYTPTRAYIETPVPWTISSYLLPVPVCEAPADVTALLLPPSTWISNKTYLIATISIPLEISQRLLDKNDDRYRTFRERSGYKPHTKPQHRPGLHKLLRKPERSNLCTMLIFHP